MLRATFFDSSFVAVRCCRRFWLTTRIVAGINKADKLPALARQQRVGAFRVCAGVLAVAFPFVGKPWTDVGLVFDSFDVLWIFAGLAWHGIAAVAGRAGESHGIFAVLQLLECFGGAVLVHRLDQSRGR